MTLLANMKTDDDVVHGLADRTEFFFGAGAYGESYRRSYISGNREEKYRRKLEESLRLCLKWYRYEGAPALVKATSYKSARRFRGDLSHRIARQIGRVGFGGLGGLLLSWFFSWILSRAIEEFVEFIMNRESAAWRDAVEGEA